MCIGGFLPPPSSESPLAFSSSRGVRKCGQDTPCNHYCRVCIVQLLRPRLITLTRDWAAYPFGFIAGILGSASTPTVPYRHLRHSQEMAADHFRANLQGYFFPANLIIIGGHAMGPLDAGRSGRYFLSPAGLSSFLSLPGTFSTPDSQGQFDRLVHISSS